MSKFRTVATRFGVLYVADEATGHAYATESEAQGYVDGGLLGALSAKFRDYTAAQGLGAQSDALELMMFADLTRAQRDWLQEFVEQWDAAQAAIDA
jgi:hypothetical protein